jgi:hypothetical protein
MEKMNNIIKEKLFQFCDILEMSKIRQEWIDLFERTETDWREKGVDFDELTKDETVLNGLYKAAILADTGLVPRDAMGQATDLVVFVLYVWWKRNICDEKPFNAIGEIDVN